MQEKQNSSSLQRFEQVYNFEMLPFVTEVTIIVKKLGKPNQISIDFKCHTIEAEWVHKIISKMMPALIAEHGYGWTLTAWGDKYTDFATIEHEFH